MTAKTFADLPVYRVIERRLKFNFLVYGESGAGKTKLCGTAFEVPELNPVLLLDIEGGGLTLRSVYPDLECLRIDSWDKLQEVYQVLKTTNHGYRTIIVDSVTEMQKLGMDHTMQVRHGGNDLSIPEIKEWNINIEQVRKYVRLFRDLDGVNSLFTALVRADTDKRTQLTRKKPSLSGKVADEICGFLDIVTYLGVEDVEGISTRILQTGNTPGTVAKDRSNFLPMLMANPTMLDIYNHIKGVENDVVRTEHVGSRG